MGNSSAASKEKGKAQSEGGSRRMAAAAGEGLETFSLEKTRPGCTGMFWRPDPRPEASASRAPSDNWPRDGAHLAGIAHEVNGQRWLECKQVRQAGSSEFADAPAGAWMPFKHEQYFLQPVAEESSS
mmetsp:Transcript_11371/g.28745  ORF Transcript_11371/g.28745 Transcript_11371/m.28745 type:complete len:127 (+) Transcript_11371:71-451(+)